MSSTISPRVIRIVSEVSDCWRGKRKKQMGMEGFLTNSWITDGQGSLLIEIVSHSQPQLCNFLIDADGWFLADGEVAADSKLLIFDFSCIWCTLLWQFKGRNVHRRQMTEGIFFMWLDCLYPEPQPIMSLHIMYPKRTRFVGVYSLYNSFETLNISKRMLKDCPMTDLNLIPTNASCPDYLWTLFHLWWLLGSFGNICFVTFELVNLNNTSLAR